MALLDDAMEKCIFMNKQKTNDGYGGITNEWTEGAEFNAAFDFNTSVEARVAEVEGVTSRYMVTTRKTINLQYNDYFKRIRDGKYFHVTSDGDDKYTPASASLDMRQVEAEEIKTLPR